MSLARLLSRNVPAPARSPQVEARDVSGPVVAWRAPRDRTLPILIIVSLMLHAVIVLPSLFRHDRDEKVTQEIPIEIVQLPPKPAPPKPAPPKPLLPKPPPPKPAQKPPPPKPAPPRTAQKPQKPPPKPAPKPAAKPAAQKPSPSEQLAKLLGMPALALPGATSAGTDEVSYAQLVLSRVAKAKKEGRYPGQPGATSVSFTLGDAGEVASVSVTRSSGQKWLDDEAVAMIRRAAPFPPPPPGGRRDFTVTLRFEPVT